MTKEITCDLAVVGGGPGGYVCAIKAAQLGVGNIVCIDKKPRLGGTCLNEGCIPSKALLQSSHMFSHAKHGMAAHGVEFSNIKFDLKKMMKQKSDCVQQLGAGIDGLMRKNKVTKVTGVASFISSSMLQVKTADGDLKINAKKIVIATGSKVATLPGINVDGKVVVTSTEALEFESTPAKLLVIGGGAIGLELSSVWSRLGSDVTVVEFADRIAVACDVEVSAKLKGYLEKQGIKFLVASQVTSIEVKNDIARVTIKNLTDNATSHIEVDRVIVAAGRKPNTDGLNIKVAGVKLDERGRVVVNNKFETNVAGIYAVGDVIQGPMLAHKAEEDGVAVAEILVGKHGHVDYNTVPSIIYTAPEVAMVGATEEQVKAANIEYRVGKFPFVANSRSVATLQTEGFVKVIANASTDEILGVHIIHEIAGELIMIAVLGMNYRASSEDIAMSCFAHPGFGEALKEACLGTYFKPIHS